MLFFNAYPKTFCITMKFLCSAFLLKLGPLRQIQASSRNKTEIGNLFAICSVSHYLKGFAYELSELIYANTFTLILMPYRVGNHS